MKKRISILSILLALAIFFLSNYVNVTWGEEKYDFRKTRWGMTMEEVRASESGEAHEIDGKLAYKQKLLDKEVGLGYNFCQNKLTGALYMLVEEHTNKNDFFGDYGEFREALTKRYGKPIENIVDWRNDLYKDDDSDWGKAVSVGHLVLHTTWETKSTKIKLKLEGENFDICCSIYYFSKELLPAIKKHYDEKDQDKF